MKTFILKIEFEGDSPDDEATTLMLAECVNDQPGVRRVLGFAPAQEPDVYWSGLRPEVDVPGVVDERAARIRVTEQRIMPQTIVTLADGQQVCFMHGRWHTRSRVSGTWTSPLLESPTQAHVPQTFYVGEW